MEKDGGEGALVWCVSHLRLGVVALCFVSASPLPCSISCGLRRHEAEGRHPACGTTAAPFLALVCAEQGTPSPLPPPLTSPREKQSCVRKQWLCRCLSVKGDLPLKAIESDTGRAAIGGVAL